MKIHFEVRDCNYKSITKRYKKLIELSEMYWSNEFSRTQLSVLFIEKNEFSEYKTHGALKNHGVEIDINDKHPETEVMGVYCPFHDKYGPDVILICPQRIDDISKRFDLSFDSLLDKVFTHELAHSLMTKDVFSLSEASLYQIPSFKFFEESLCNAFALLHFNNQENELLKTFCRSQPSGYCDFHIWGDSFKNISSSMNNYKNLKGDCYCLINACWFKSGDDFLFKSKVNVDRILSGQETAHFNCYVNVARKLKQTPSHDFKTPKSTIYNLLTLKGVVWDGSVFSDDMKKSADELCRKIGDPIIERTQYLYRQEIEGYNYYICLDINGVSVFHIEKGILENIKTDNFKIISLINA